MIVVGLGSGRTGTTSLAKLLGSQKNSLCFHEMNPSCTRFIGAPQPSINLVNEFQRILDGGPRNRLTVDFAKPSSARTFDTLQGMEKVDLLGDIALYHIQYIEDMIDQGHPIRFVCMWRSKEEVVESFIAKTKINRRLPEQLADFLSCLITRKTYHTHKNHWMTHDGRNWAPDPVWDKCFPKFDAGSPREAVRMYWDYYYEIADSLSEKYPNIFKIFHIETLNDDRGQRSILSFCGIPESEHILTKAHENRAAS